MLRGGDSVTNITESYHCQYPYEFMKDFIEATYNLFQIQQKRIEELEDIVLLDKS